MGMKRSFLPLLACLFYAFPEGFAQQPRGDQAGFQRKAPAVGQALPDLNAHTIDGKALNLNRLKGHHTVLVFGCLT